MKYIIRKHTLDRAKQYDLLVFPVEDGVHKIEVYDKDGHHLADVGDINYNDYAQYLAMEQMNLLPKGYANSRRKLYLNRHKHETGFDEPYSRSWLAKTLLW
jgi:hypothetical protein